MAAPIRNLRGAWRTVVVAAALAVALPAAGAEVSIDHRGLKLNGFSELAAGKSWRDGAVLLVHGTLVHGQMDTIKSLQRAFKEQGRSSLAITLSLGIPDRRGNFDCARPHTHRHADAIAEIATWVKWLRGQGADNITIMGHSRGGNQVARYALDAPDPAAKRIVLLAPATWNGTRVAGEYERRFKTSLARVLNAARDLADKGKGKEMLTKVGFLYCPDATVAAATFLSYYTDDKRMDTPSILGGISVPVLVIGGTTDTIIPDLAERMMGRATGSVKFRTVEGADHFFLDLFADDVAEIVAKN